MEKVARSTFELNNNIKALNAAEAVFLYDRETEKQLEDEAPWKTDPHYFTTVKISAVALIKMAIHARSGGQYEIMGVMYGKVRDHTFWITDVAALPVQGTETRVNAGNEAMEYMVQFQMANDRAGKTELLRGWYHSHPGYGCWLSGIDVNTQMHNQRHTDPYLAIVVDPNRTISAGKVEIGAFRTYPDGYTPPAGGSSEYQSIPMDKIEDFGAHANSYYPLKIEIFKTQTDEKLLDLLWNKYWVATLSQSNILSNRAYSTSQIKDLNNKIASAASKLGETGADLKLKPQPAGHSDAELKDTRSKSAKRANFPGVEMGSNVLTGPVKDGLQIANEAKNGITAQVVKNQLFNQPLDHPLQPQSALVAVQGAWSK